VRNFDWLPFTPLWSPSPVLQLYMVCACFHCFVTLIFSMPYLRHLMNVQCSFKVQMDAIFVMICCRDKHGYPVVTFPCVACKFDQDNRLIKKKHIVCIAWWYIHRICVAIYDSNYCSFVSNDLLLPFLVPSSAVGQHRVCSFFLSSFVLGKLIRAGEYIYDTIRCFIVLLLRYKKVKVCSLMSKEISIIFLWQKEISI
jgi:hypothetical protein